LTLLMSASRGRLGGNLWVTWASDYSRPRARGVSRRPCSGLIAKSECSCDACGRHPAVRTIASVYDGTIRTRWSAVCSAACRALDGWLLVLHGPIATIYFFESVLGGLWSGAQMGIRLSRMAWRWSRNRPVTWYDLLNLRARRSPTLRDLDDQSLAVMSPWAGVVDWPDFLHQAAGI